MEDKFIVDCSCGCSKLEFKELHGDHYLSAYYATFYSKQDGIWSRFKERVKMLWFILLGKDFHLYEMVIYKDQWQQFKKFIQETE